MANREAIGAVRASDMWEQIKARLGAKITPQAFQNWMYRTELESQENGVLRVLVPDQVTKDFLEQEYGSEIHEAIRELKLPIQTVLYVTSLSQNTGASQGPASNTS